MSYASVQAIREGAGLLSYSENETPTGAVDGNNSVFVVARRPIVDSDNDDEVTVEDVQAFVDGLPVEVSDVNAATGSVTLAAAPAADTEVTLDYHFSPITDEYTAGKQQEADSWVDLILSAAGTPQPLKLPLDHVPGIVATAAELYASGLILIRDWGNRVDSELTSKDGFNKIKQARDLLKDYIAGVKVAQQQAANPAADSNSVSVATDPDVFSRQPDEFGSPYGDPTDDEFFMRRR